MKRFQKAVLFAVTVLGVGFAQAQQATELTAHPKQVRTFTITFHGTDADKVQKVLGTLMRTDPQPEPSQSGFKTSAPSEWVTQTPAKTFVVTITIPDDIMDGSYHLQVDVNATKGTAEYLSGRDFQLPDIHIKNGNSFTPPKIEVKETH